MAQPLTEEQLNTKLKDLTGWEFKDDFIFRKFEFNNFKEALAFIVRVGFEAEEQAHHPNLSNVYNTVNISLQTHDADNQVTQKDIDLATAINAVL